MAVASLSDSLELFFGTATPSLCRVYARCAGGDDLQLTGTLSGPTCIYGQTLPATFTFVDRGPGPTRLAETLLPEPSFWTPEMPELYRARLELRRGAELVEKIDRPFGIRPLGASGNRLIYAGKNWVLRGVALPSPSISELPAWHDADTALVVSSPDDALCEAASRVGVLIVALIDEPTATEIARLARWPAVGFIVLPRDAAADFRERAGNTILVQRVATPDQIRPWADALLVEAATIEPFGSRLPLIAYRPAHAQSVNEGRQRCDRLQHELAGGVRIAGYLV